MQHESNFAYGTGISPIPPEEDRTPSRLTIALAWVSAQRARDRVFDAGWFANPAWDVLLDLYISFAQQHTETVGNACLSSSAPPSTTMRSIAALEADGLIQRQPDPKDKRRVLLELTDVGRSKVEQALDGSIQSDAKLGLGRMQLIDRGR